MCGCGASSFGVLRYEKTVLERFLFEFEETSRSSRVLEEQIFKSNKSFMHRVTFLNFSHFEVCINCSNYIVTLNLVKIML